MPLRSSSLLRFLFAASIPFAAVGGVAVVPLTTLSGCACGDGTTVFPISQQDHDRLLKLYGSDGLPVGECQAICISSVDGDADAGPDGGVAEPAPRILSVTECSLTTIEWDTPAAICTGTLDCGGSGRRPAGLLPADRVKPSPSALGAHFARMARLEAASVPAFLDLASELAAHGAPPDLARAAERAAAEEITHARVMARLARRHGAAPLAARVAPRSERDLEAMALENTREGCVFEAFGAAILAHQARNALDPALRAALAAISADEASHAELSHRIHTWALSRLARPARRRLAQAREEALSELAAAHEAEPARDLAPGLGLPSAERAQSLIATLPA